MDHCHYRFIYSEPDADLPLEEVGRLLTSIQNIGLRWINLEKLQEFDSKRGFTKAQGED